MYMKIGFIGLGLMGNPMAKNILNSGFELHVYNRTKQKTNELRDLGAIVCDTILDLTSNVDVLITIVTGPKDVEEVLFGDGGVVSAKKKNITVIDMSTIGPTAAKSIGEKLKQHSIDFLDAPVTGSVPRAITGELTIFIGGEKSVVEKIRPVLLAMGKSLHHIGPVGSGQAVKLINNHLVATTVSALAEAILLGDVLQIDREKIVSALVETPVFSPFMKLNLPNFVKDEYPTAFSVANMYKDLAIALEEINKSKTELPILEMVKEFYKKSIEKGLGNADISSVIKINP